MVRLRVALFDVQPTVWRLVQVPAMIPLDKLHDVIQAAMGWTDSHMHEFIINGVSRRASLPTRGCGRRIGLREIPRGDQRSRT